MEGKRAVSLLRLIVSSTGDCHKHKPVRAATSRYVLRCGGPLCPNTEKVVYRRIAIGEGEIGESGRWMMERGVCCLRQP